MPPPPFPSQRAPLYANTRVRVPLLAAENPPPPSPSHAHHNFSSQLRLLAVLTPRPKPARGTLRGCDKTLQGSARERKKKRSCNFAILQTRPGVPNENAHQNEATGPLFRIVRAIVLPCRCLSRNPERITWTTFRNFMAASWPLCFLTVAVARRAASVPSFLSSLAQTWPKTASSPRPRRSHPIG